MVFALFVAFAVVASAAVALFMYWSVKSREGRNIWPVVFAIMVAGIVAVVAYTNYIGISWFFFTSVAVAALSSMLPVLYRRRSMAFALVIFVLAFAAAISLNRMATMGMFGVGTVVGMLYSERYLIRKREDRSMRKTVTEMRRDLIQVIGGVVVLAIMFLWQQSYLYILFWVILLAYLFISLISKTGGIYNLLSKFERRESEFGIGAIHLAAGAAILLGFAGFKLALFGIFPLFFGDALATMTGLSFYRSRKLPYNRRKSYAGTIAFLIASVVPGFIILGFWGILLGLILTLVESVELPIDDNIAVPIGTVILGALFGLG
ncbi:MAG: hypothetical protein KGH94_03820 [Candidatus Micrarchaeota archaeon]|nr:hypothetical protein [Candidatus Micrarchaeota archaeon]